MPICSLVVVLVHTYACSYSAFVMGHHNGLARPRDCIRPPAS